MMDDRSLRRTARRPTAHLTSALCLVAGCNLLLGIEAPDEADQPPAVNSEGGTQTHDDGSENAGSNNGENTSSNIGTDKGFAAKGDTEEPPDSDDHADKGQNGCEQGTGYCDGSTWITCDQHGEFSEREQCADWCDEDQGCVPCFGESVHCSLECRVKVALVPEAGTQTSLGWERQATVHLTPTIEPSWPTENGDNPAELALLTDQGPYVGVAGGLWFMTNTGLCHHISCKKDLGAFDSAHTSLSIQGRHPVLFAHVDEMLARSFRDILWNSFSLDTGVTAPIYWVLSGQVQATFDPDWAYVNGTVNLGGASTMDAEAATRTYQAAFEGRCSRIAPTTTTED